MIIFDLDGTLADITHRLHFIQGDSKDWDAFHRACISDVPIKHTIKVCQALLNQHHEIEIWSGRSDLVRAETEVWLRKYVWPGIDDSLRMRVQGDYTPDDRLKESWLDHCLSNGHTIELAFDDRQRMVNMWRRRGIPCFQVAKGDF